MNTSITSNRSRKKKNSDSEMAEIYLLNKR